MKELYFEELETPIQETIKEVLSRAVVSYFENAKIKNGEYEGMKKAIMHIIKSNNKKRTVEDWLSWSTTEASKPSVFDID